MTNILFTVGDLVRIINNNDINRYHRFADKEGEIIRIWKNKISVKLGPESIVHRDYPYNQNEDYFIERFFPDELEKINSFSLEVIASRMFGNNMWHRVSKLERQDGQPIIYDGSMSCAVPDCQGKAIIETVFNFIGTVCFYPTCQSHHVRLHGKRVESF